MSITALELKRQYMRAYRTKNREHIREVNKAWRDKNKEVVRANSAKYWERKAGEEKKCEETQNKTP